MFNCTQGVQVERIRLRCLGCLIDTQDVQVKRIHKNIYVISVVLTVELVRQHRRRRARYVRVAFGSALNVEKCCLVWKCPFRFEKLFFVVIMCKNVPAPNFDSNQILFFLKKREREFSKKFSKKRGLNALSLFFPKKLSY